MVGYLAKGRAKNLRVYKLVRMHVYLASARNSCIWSNKLYSLGWISASFLLSSIMTSKHDINLKLDCKYVKFIISPLHYAEALFY